MKDKYPMQPIMNGRFESNPIVDWLCTELSSMNDIAHYCAENDIAYKYQEQLAQLVGYSVGGYGSLSCVSDESYERAENQMNIDNLATQTPEEKEVLDSIKSVHLRDYQKADKPHVKVEYEKWNFECAWHAIKAFEDGEKLYTKRSHKDFILIDNAQDVIRFLYSIYERIEYDESPQQREDRERLEAVEEMFTYWSDDKGDFCAGDDDDRWVKELLFSLYDSGYRKESN